MSQIVFYGSAEQCKHYEEELGKAIRAAYPDLPWERWEAEKQAKEMERNDKGYPLDENGDIDWEQTSKEKQEVADKHGFDGNKRRGKVRAKRTNYTPPKKKRKKR